MKSRPYEPETYKICYLTLSRKYSPTLPLVYLGLYHHMAQIVLTNLTDHLQQPSIHLFILDQHTLCSKAYLKCSAGYIT